MAMWLPGSGSLTVRDLLPPFRFNETPVIASTKDSAGGDGNAPYLQSHEDLAQKPGINRIPDGLHDFGRASKETWYPRHISTLENGGIVYGDTSLTADSITIYLDDPAPGVVDRTPKGTVIANGHAILTNPVGKLQADRISLNYISRTGTASHATIDAPGIILDAVTVEVTPGHYVLHDVVAKSIEKVPVYYIHADRVEVKVGDKLVATHAQLKLFNKPIYTFPQVTRSLDERVSGLNYPTLSLNSGFQPGINFNSSVLINDYTALAGTYGAAPGSYPSYSLQVSKSSIDPGQTVGFITPRTDLDERDGYGYFDNVSVRDPSREYAYISAPRSTFSIGTFWNRGTIDRLDYQVFSKPIELSYEQALRFGPFRTLTQASVEDVRLEFTQGYIQTGTPIGSDHIRLVAQSILETPPWNFSDNANGYFRLAGSTFQGGDHSFSWVQSQIGALYTFPRYFRVGGAFVLSSEFGDPLFVSDELYSESGFNSRADIQYGPRTISLLTRYDYARNRFYDHEVRFSQLSGLFSPFIAIRAFPSSIRIGVTMRVDNPFKATERSSISLGSTQN